MDTPPVDTPPAVSVPADSALDEVSTAVHAAVAWLDAHNGRDRFSVTLQLLKVQEEAGEVAAAWIGATGTNPRKGVTHTVADVAAELADVVITALVGIEALGFDHRTVLAAAAAKITRITAP